MKPYVYNVVLERVVDGDTIDVTINLGFDVQLKKQRLRLHGIDTPEKPDTQPSGESIRQSRRGTAW